MKDTKIEWADDTVNPWWGCERISPACTHCYAETLAARFHAGLWGPGSERRLRLYKAIGELESIARRGEREGRIRRVFIASMSDVFEDRPDLAEPRKRLWDALHRLDGRLIPMLLTKRPAVMAAWAKEHGWPAGAWAGTTVEDQRRADERIPELQRFDVATRFLSMEPLLGPVDLGRLWPMCWSWPGRMDLKEAQALGLARRRPQGLVMRNERPISQIDWIIVGGESGSKARPMHPEWAQSLRDQAVAANVPFLFKQWGEFLPTVQVDAGDDIADYDVLVDNGTSSAPFSQAAMTRVGKKAAGRLLDGRTWDEVPTP